MEEEGRGSGERLIVSPPDARSGTSPLLLHSPIPPPLTCARATVNKRARMCTFASPLLPPLQVFSLHPPPPLIIPLSSSRICGRKICGPAFVATGQALSAPPLPRALPSSVTDAAAGAVRVHACPSQDQASRVGDFTSPSPSPPPPLSLSPPPASASAAEERKPRQPGAALPETE